MPPWISTSTRAFLQEALRHNKYNLFDFFHGYIYGRWPYLYIGIGTGEHRLAQSYLRLNKLWKRLSFRRNNSSTLPDRPAKSTIADGYHGKVLPFESASRLVTINQEIVLNDLEQIIPYSRARDIILKHPDHIVALDCPCRSARPNPCLPIDVCLVVGEPFASFVSEHHPQRSRWISPHEAEEILSQEHARGHVHHAFFKDAMLGRFYAICNCCSCCCGAMHAHQSGVPMLASSGYVSSLDENLCIGCEECIQTCQFFALTFNHGSVQVHESKCMGCGVCVSICLQGALSLIKAPSRGEPLDIQTLINRVN
jgi:NAD-dependent dihydropyrimidine dehydrogenase PreA subunit